MAGFLKFMSPALIAALMMAPLHALFGLHIVRRGLIFIDLAIAQVAALGMSLAIVLGNEPGSFKSYVFAIGFALGGALLFSLSKFRLGRVPQEAIIGIVYVLSTAMSMVILESDPSGHGLEELREMLSGNILFVSDGELTTVAWTYGIVLVVLLLAWRPISALTLQREKDEISVKSVCLDFLFYALLGLVVANSVKVAGVLIVFSWLVMPAVVAFFFVEKMLPAVLIALPVGVLASIGGLWASYAAPPLRFGSAAASAVSSAGSDTWPTGPAIVVALGATVVAAYVVRMLVPQKGSNRVAALEE